MNKKKIDTTSPSKPLSSSPFAQLAIARDTLPTLDEQAPANAPAPPAANATNTASFARAVVRKERKGHGGKTATVIEGVPAAQLEKMSDAMKRAFGCGARVEGELIVLQGELVDRAAEWLSKNGAKRVVRSG